MAAGFAPPAIPSCAPADVAPGRAHDLSVAARDERRWKGKGSRHGALGCGHRDRNRRQVLGWRAKLPGVLIAIPLFDKVTALDAIGPYEVLQRLPDAEVRFLGVGSGPGGDRPATVRTDNGMLGLVVDATLDDVPTPDVVVVPGGIGTRKLIPHSPLIDWVRAAHPTTRFTTSVCTGALVLAAAGLLDGLTATTHWAAYGELRQLGATPVERRVVEHLDHRIITAAGVSSGIDMALRLAELLVDRTTAEAMQLTIEYDPHPPFDAGAPSKVGEDVMARTIEIAQTRN